MAGPILPDALPKILEGWEDVVALASAPVSQEVFERRLQNYEKAAQNGRTIGNDRTWTLEILDALYDHIRPLVQHPLRPALGLREMPSSSVSLGPQPVTKSKAPFTWAWLGLRLTWVDEGGSEVHVFPFPVACLEAPVLGSRHMASLTAFYHLLPKPDTEAKGARAYR